jgi:hypothetical protein
MDFVHRENRLQDEEAEKNRFEQVKPDDSVPF